MRSNLFFENLVLRIVNDELEQGYDPPCALQRAAHRLGLTDTRVKEVWSAFQAR